MTINAEYFMHPNDKKAMDALKAIPGFDALGKTLMKNFSEKQFHIMNMSGRIRLSKDQMPEIYEMLPPICEKLGIEEPELYLELNRTPNAYTYGVDNAFIVITTGLLEYVDPEDIKAVLAHECGHIACHHTLYRTMGSILISGLPIPGVSQALRLAFTYWMRCSEFSADRASAYVMGGSEPVIHLLTRLAGAGKDLPYNINTDLFISQAEEYKKYIGESDWNKALEALLTASQSHPLTAVRALELRDWCNTDEFNDLDNILTKNLRIKTIKIDCPSCQREIPNDSHFCPYCGHKIEKED